MIMTLDNNKKEIVMSDTFVSAALGAPHEYRSFFSDRVYLVTLAKNPLNHDGGNCLCREVASGTPFSDIYHTKKQVQQVVLDLDAADMAS
jgi:hypothetical protein